MKPLGESVPLGRVKVPVHAEETDIEFEFGGVSCSHEGVTLWDSNGHNFLDIIGYHHPDELQIVVDLMNNYAPIVYAARDLLEQVDSGKGGSLDKLFDMLRMAIIGKPGLEEGDDNDDEEYTLDEIQFDL